MMSDLPDLSVSARRVVIMSKKIAKDLFHDFVTTEHILLSILEVASEMKRKPLSIRILEKVAIDLDPFKEFVTNNLCKYKGPEKIELDDIELSGRALKMFSYAGSIAHELKDKNVDLDHIFMSILVSDTGSGNNLFKLKNIDVNVLYEHIYDRAESSRMRRRKTKQTDSQEPSQPQEVDEPAASPDNVLDKFATNLTLQAMTGELDPVIGRDEETREMIQVLSRRTKNNPVLVGEPGVGKTAVVELLAHKIVTRDVPLNLVSKQIYTLDLAQLVAGTIYRGQFEERLKSVVAYVQEKPEIILFIDELHMLVGAGSTTGSMDASNILKPALARGKISCIGATTIQEYKEFIEGDGALDRRFQTIFVDEPTKEDTVNILDGIKEKYETFHNVKYNKAAVKEIAYLCDRYMPEKNFPDKAIDILDELGSRARTASFPSSVELKLLQKDLEQIVAKKNKSVESNDFDIALAYRMTERELAVDIEGLMKQREMQEQKKGVTRITVQDVRDIISDKTGVTSSSMEDDELTKISRLSNNMKKHIIGQADGVEKICDAIKRNKAGVSDPNKPICSLLFLGPTGVGKTHLARTLGEEMFNAGNFRQYNMSEFSEAHSISKLIGSPPGYVGFGEGGDLTEYVRRTPYCVLLFDEIEKAHHDVLQIFLQILEYGMLTDSDGLEVNLKNTIIVMTSNIGAHMFEKRSNIGFGGESSTYDSVIRELKKTYAPEFINRFDELVLFDKLENSHLIKICSLLLSQLKTNIKNNSSRTVTFSKDVAEYIVNLCGQSEYGARPLKRMITERIETALADYIIRNSQSKRINVDIEGDRVTFS